MLWEHLETRKGHGFRGTPIYIYTRNKKLLGARTLLVAPGLTTRSKDTARAPGLTARNKKLLGARTLLVAPGLTTRSKDTARAPGLTTSSKDATSSSWPHY